MSNRGGVGEDFEKVESIGKGLAEKATALATDGSLKRIEEPFAIHSGRAPITIPPVQYRLSENTRFRRSSANWHWVSTVMSPCRFFGSDRFSWSGFLAN